MSKRCLVERIGERKWTRKQSSRYALDGPKSEEAAVDIRRARKYLWMAAAMDELLLPFDNTEIRVNAFNWIWILINFWQSNFQTSPEFYRNRTRIDRCWDQRDLQLLGSSRCTELLEPLWRQTSRTSGWQCLMDTQGNLQVSLWSLHRNRLPIAPAFESSLSTRPRYRWILENSANRIARYWAISSLSWTWCNGFGCSQYGYELLARPWWRDNHIRASNSIAFDKAWNLNERLQSMIDIDKFLVTRIYRHRSWASIEVRCKADIVISGVRLESEVIKPQR